ncbi:hypothetical protein LINPERHAP2_LOCUS35445, partial [Linum perenne]
PAGNHFTTAPSLLAASVIQELPSRRLRRRFRRKMMKLAPQTIFLFKDNDGFSSAIAKGLAANPSSGFQKLEDSFELPLDSYGVKDRKACGDLVHFVDRQGNLQVSLLLLEKYEPPMLACALNEVLAHIVRASSSTLPTFIFPFTGASKLKWETKAPPKGQVKLYSIQSGPETDIAQVITSRTQTLPSSLHIHYEPLACYLQLARVLKLSTCVVFGLGGHQGSGDEIEALDQIGDLLGNSTGLCFLKDEVSWNPRKTSKECAEPWRALYG